MRQSPSRGDTIRRPVRRFVHAVLTAGVMVWAGLALGCPAPEKAKPVGGGEVVQTAPAEGKEPARAPSAASTSAPAEVRAAPTETGDDSGTTSAARDGDTSGTEGTTSEGDRATGGETTGRGETESGTSGGADDTTRGEVGAEEDAETTETAETAETGADGSGNEGDVQEVTKAPLTKVLLLGDSLIATGFGVRLESLLDGTPGVVAYRKGKSASGLARPDFFDWMREAQHQVNAREPDVVIILMGGNDGQDLTSTGTSKRRVRWKSDAWQAAYAARVDELLARTWAPGRTIIWLGLPKMGMRSLERKLALIREIQRARVATKPGAVYMDISPHLVNSEGDLKVYGIVRGKRKALRAEDGIHFTMAGSDFLADAILQDVLRSFGYRAPRKP